MKLKAALLLLGSALLCSPTARAADAQICYSPHVAVVTTGGFGTTLYPQATNNTLFACRSGVQFTIGQLAARGWKIVMLTPTVYSIETSATQAKTVQRFQLLVSN